VYERYSTRGACREIHTAGNGVARKNFTEANIYKQERIKDFAKEDAHW